MLGRPGERGRPGGWTRWRGRGPERAAPSQLRCPGAPPSRPERASCVSWIGSGEGVRFTRGSGRLGRGDRKPGTLPPKPTPWRKCLGAGSLQPPARPPPAYPPRGWWSQAAGKACSWPIVGGEVQTHLAGCLQHPGDGQSLPAGPAETPGPLSCPACCEGPGLGQSQQRPRGGLRAPPQVPAPLPGAACSPPRCSHPRSSAGQTECPGPRPQPHMASIQAGPLRPLHSAPPRPAQEGASSCTAQTGTVAGAGWAGSGGWAEAAQWVWGLKSGSLSRVTLHCVTLDTKANLSQPVSWSAKWVHTQNPDQHVLKGAPFTTGATGPASALSWRCCELGHWEPVPGRQQGTVEALRGAGVSYRAGQGSQQGPTGRVSAHPDERPLHLASPELWVGSPPACRASCPWWEPARQAAVGRLGLSCPSGVLSSPCPQPGRRGGLPAVLDAPRPPP